MNATVTDGQRIEKAFPQRAGSATKISTQRFMARPPSGSKATAELTLHGAGAAIIVTHDVLA